MEENITSEFVKEWIDKHNLSKGSFDRIMNDLIYNSGHYYIDDPSLRYWLIDNTYKFRDMLPVELNKSQQIVLEWLKRELTKHNITYALWELLDDVLELEYETGASEAWNRLDECKKFQVLAAFAEWGMEEVAE